VVTWRSGKERGGEKRKGKEEGRRRGNKGKQKEEEEVEKNARTRKDGEEETRAKEKEEKEEVEKNARARKKDEEEETRAKEKEEGEAENNNMRGQLCIPKTMRGQILHEAHDTPAGGHFGADRTYLRIKDRYFWKKMWPDTQRYVVGCDLCHRTNHRSGTHMGLLQRLPIA
jgi:hypothetical protein